MLKSQENDEDLDIKEDTVVEITKDSYIFSGGILKCYQTLLVPIIEELFATLGGSTTNPFNFSGQDLTNYRSYCKILLNTEELNVPQIIIIMNFIKNQISRLSNEKQDQIKRIIDKFDDIWLRIIDKLPVFFFENI